MKHLGIPQLFRENVVAFCHMRGPGGCHGFCVLCRLLLAKGHVEKGIRREEASLDVTRSPTHGESNLDPALQSRRTRREPWCLVPDLCRFGKHRLCQKLEQDGFHDRQRTLRSPWFPLATPGAAGRGPVRTPNRACASRPSRRPPAQPRSLPVAVATGSRGGGAAPRRLLFLPLPVPRGHVAMATELLSSAASRPGWRA